MDTTKRSEGLSVFTAIAFAVGTMVGAGVFVLSGIVIETAGTSAKLSNGQPINSILLGAIITFLLILYGNLGFIVNLTNTTVLISMFIVNISAFMLVKKEEKMVWFSREKSYFRLPFGRLFPMLGSISSILMLFTLPMTTIIMGIGALFVGTIFYMMEDTRMVQIEIMKIRKLLGRPTDYRFLT